MSTMNNDELWNVRQCCFIVYNGQFMGLVNAQNCNQSSLINGLRLVALQYYPKIESQVLLSFNYNSFYWNLYLYSLVIIAFFTRNYLCNAFVFNNNDYH